MAEAVAAVASHYPLVSRGMTPEAQAWLALMTTAGMIYGPKFTPLLVEKLTSARKPPRTNVPTNQHGQPIQ